MRQPKLILLYGFAASGKTTLAKRYVDEHPLAIAIEGDQIIGMMGQWRKHEDEARKLVFEHTKSITENQLEAGYDVVLPYLLTDSTHAQAFEEIAKRLDVSFYEIYIETEKDEAIDRLLKRGVWGEDGSPKLSKDDLPEIENLFERMTKAMSERLNITTIASVLGDIEGTYTKLLTSVS